MSPDEDPGCLLHAPDIELPVVTPCTILQEGVANRPVEHGVAIRLRGCTVARVKAIIHLFQGNHCQIGGEVMVYQREQALCIDNRRKHEARHLTLGVNAGIGAPCPVEPDLCGLGHIPAGSLRQGLLNHRQKRRLHGAAVALLPAAKACTVVGNHEFVRTGFGGATRHARPRTGRRRYQR